MNLRSTLVVGSTCIFVIALFFLSDILPPAVFVLFPGFYLAILINGSLHDHVMRGYAAIAVAFDCIFYSALALGGEPGVLARLGGRDS